MLYSVFDYHAKKYDYYEAPGSISPIAKMRPPKGSWSPKGEAFLPQALAVTLPASAKHVGSGQQMKGLAAKKVGGLDAWLPEESKPSAGWAALFVAVGLGGGWLMSKAAAGRKKK